MEQHTDWWQAEPSCSLINVMHFMQLVAKTNAEAKMQEGA